MTINISEELPARKNAPAVAAKSSAKKGDAKGGTPQENSAKRVRQAVYDIRYRARREDIDLRKAYSEYMANSNLSAQEKTAVREKLFGKQGGGVSEQYMVTSVDWAEKNFADAYHKVFVEGIKKEEPAIELVYEQELAEEPERKYKVRVFDPKSEKSYVRFATREKISKLRAKGLKVEMTEHGEAYEGEKKKGEQTAAAMGGGKKNVNEDAFDPNFVDRKRKEQDRPEDKKQQAPTDASGGPTTNRIGPGSSGGSTNNRMGPTTSGGSTNNRMGPTTSGGRTTSSMGPGTSGGRTTGSIKAKPLATLNRGKKGDGFLGPTISAGGVRIGIPNLSPIRREALDPVGQEDGDVNNDGKKDKTDKYLMNRRKAVGKAIAKKKGEKSVNEQSYLDQLKASEKAMREEEKAAIKARAEKGRQALERAGGAAKAIEKLRNQAGVNYDNDPNMVKTAPGIYSSKEALKIKNFKPAFGEEFITDGATGTTSTEGQNAREIDVLPDKVAKKLQQVTVMPQDGTNPQVGKAPLMMSQQMEGEQLTEEEEDRRERYAFMNVARNLVRAKTGAKRPIAMDPEGTYKKAKEDLAKMVNSGNPDKDKEETPCEEKQLSMADTFKKIVENAAVKEKDSAEKDAAEKKLESKKETTKPTEKPKSKDDTTGGYTIPDDAKPKTRLNTTTKSDTTKPTTKPSSGGQVKSSGPSGTGSGGMTSRERISRVDAGKDPYPMLSQDAKLRMSLGIKDIESISPFKDEKGNGGHAAFMAQFGLKPYGTQPDNLGRNNPTDMPRPNAMPKKDAAPKVKAEGKQLSMADTFKQIAEGGVPSQDGQVDEYKRRAQEAERKRKMNPDGTPRKPQPQSTGGGGYNKYKLPSRPADGSGTGI